MIYPSFINENDTIGVTAPSDGIVKSLKVKRIDNAYRILNSLGFTVKETDSVKNRIKIKVSNTPEKRVEELNELFENKNIKMVFAAAGGEFMNEIMPFIDFNIIKNNPKWFQGFSDPTWLTYTITTICDIATIYGSNMINFGMNPWHKSLDNNLDILKGNIVTQHNYKKYQEYHEYKKYDEPYILTKNVKWKSLYNNNIDITGRIIGGCFDILSYIIGTKYDNTINFIEKYKNDGIIWYFDNCELNNENVCRLLWQLREAGWFKYTKLIIFGRTGNDESNLKLSFKDALHKGLDGLDIPVIYDADIGHIMPQITIINGSICHTTLINNKSTIDFYLK